ncbi:MAG: hypothetical protein QCI38_02765 [Candidatus Thermoplasmatota archaeon]|nr:hypothetical protein [Candidatus Thermoplasmatota archaeon]
MDAVDVWLRAWLLAISTALFFVSVAGYRRERDGRMLVAAGLFFLFLLKGLVLMLGLFSWSAELLVAEPWFDRVFDVAVLLFVILYVWKVPRKAEGGEPKTVFRGGDGAWSGEGEGADPEDEG